MQFFGPRPGWHLIDLRELWRFRDLVWILALRDIKVRYRQTAVGVLWAILQPFTTMVIFTTLFTLLGRTPSSGDVPYAVAAFCGLIPWQLFANTLTQASGSLVANQNLITKVYFPRAVLPLASLIGSLVDFAIASVILLAMLAWYGITPGWPILLIPVFVGLVMLASLAAGLWLSAANGLYRDVGYVVPFLIQVGFYLSPVVYESGTLIPERWQFVHALNPMVGVLEGFRWALLGHRAPPVESLMISLTGLAVLLIGGMLYFRRVERYLADRI